LPGAIFIVDVKREHIAVSEANRLGIPVVAIVDTNVDPTPIPYVIPANDDAFRSIGLVTRLITDAIVEGQAMVQEVRPVEEAEERPAARAETEPRMSRRPPRRVRRKTAGRSEEPQTSEPAPEASGEPAGKYGDSAASDSSEAGRE
jgi:small subunit ribosomal protein S2